MYEDPPETIWEIGDRPFAAISNLPISNLNASQIVFPLKESQFPQTEETQL